MNLLFNTSLFILSSYLILDVALQSEESGGRAIIQLVAGLAMVVMSVYVFSFSRSLNYLMRHWSFVRVWSFFVFLMFVYYIFGWVDIPSTLASRNVRELLIAVFILTSLLFAYTGTLRGHFSDTKVKLLIVLIALNGIIELYYAISNPLIRKDMDVVNTSAGYMFLMLSPLLLYVYGQHSIWIFFGTMVLTLMTGKRGALVGYGIIFLYSLIRSRLFVRRARWTWTSALFVIALVVAIVIFASTALDSFIFRWQNLENERTGNIASGRDVMWTAAFYKWWEGGIFNLAFGNGYYSTNAYITAHVAHNDFVQYLTDYGIIGLVLYLTVLVLFYLNIRKMVHRDNYLYVLLITCLIIWLVRAFFAGTNRTDHIVLAISMGYLMAKATSARSSLIKDGAKNNN